MSSKRPGHYEVCAHCGGSGRVVRTVVNWYVYDGSGDRDEQVECPRCDRGYVFVPDPLPPERLCAKCKGSGRGGWEGPGCGAPCECDACGGTGMRREPVG